MARTNNQVVRAFTGAAEDHLVIADYQIPKASQRTRARAAEILGGVVVSLSGAINELHVRTLELHDRSLEAVDRTGQHRQELPELERIGQLNSGERRRRALPPPLERDSLR